MNCYATTITSANYMTGVKALKANFTDIGTNVLIRAYGCSESIR